MSEDYDDLRAAVSDLEAALADLREDLGGAADRESRAGEESASPEATLRLLEEVALPTLEGLLAANLETLEATRTAVREARRTIDRDEDAEEDDARDDEEDDATDVGSSDDHVSAGPNGGDRNDVDGPDPGVPEPADARDPYARRRADAAERVGEAVDRVREALDGSALPEDAPGRDLIEEARGLRAEIDESIEYADPDAAQARGTNADSEGGPAEPDPDSTTEVDGSASRDGPSRSATDDAVSEALEVDAASNRDVDPPAEVPDAPDAGGPVDVDAELETIRESVRREDAVLRGETPEEDEAEWTFDGESDAGDDGYSEPAGSDGVAAAADPVAADEPAAVRDTDDGAADDRGPDDGAGDDREPDDGAADCRDPNDTGTDGRDPDDPDDEVDADH